MIEWKERYLMKACLKWVRYCSCQERKPKPDIFDLTRNFLLIASTTQRLLVKDYHLWPWYRKKKTQENQVQETPRKSILRLLIYFCKEFCVPHLSDFMVRTLSNIKLSHYNFSVLYCINQYIFQCILHHMNVMKFSDTVRTL